MADVPNALPNQWIRAAMPVFGHPCKATKISFFRLLADDIAYVGDVQRVHDRREKERLINPELTSKEV